MKKEEDTRKENENCNQLTKILKFREFKKEINEIVWNEYFLLFFLYI